MLSMLWIFKLTDFKKIEPDLNNFLKEIKVVVTRLFFSGLLLCLFNPEISIPRRSNFK